MAFFNFINLGDNFFVTKCFINIRKFFVFSIGEILINDCFSRLSDIGKITDGHLIIVANGFNIAFNLSQNGKAFCNTIS